MTEITERQLQGLLFPTINNAAGEVIAQGVGLSSGVATGRVIKSVGSLFDLDDGNLIYCKDRLSGADLALLSDRRIMGYAVKEADEASHEVIILRASGVPLVGGINVSEICARDVTINGNDGFVYSGLSEITKPDLGSMVVKDAIAELVRNSRITVRANADTPLQTRTARLLGARGLGPVRTEYMFYQDGRLPVMQRFILMGDDSALEELAKMQEADFKGIYTEMQGFPVGIRLFDPPFNEFCPKSEDEVRRLAVTIDVSYSTLVERINNLAQDNPMLAVRGARLGILQPEVYKMQIYAAFNAAASLLKQGYDIKPDITVPFVGLPKEMEIIRRYIDDIAGEVGRKEDVSINYTVTAMIELPIACYSAQGIAESVDGFSFGTNDLAQTMYGMSRTDMGDCLRTYREAGIIDTSPFSVLSDELVELVSLGIERGRKGNKDLQVGVCGEQAASSDSVMKCINAGLDYVSCSPYRVPFVNLAAQKGV